MKIEEKGDALVVTDFNELEAFKIACKIEKDGILFYRNLAENAKNEELREKLGFLLAEEEKHLKFFEEQLDKFRQERGDGFEEDDLLNYLDYGVFRPYRDIKEMLVERLDDIRRVLRLAVLIEDKTIRFYEACSRKVSVVSPQVLREIIEEEKRHKKLFENMAQDLEAR